MNFSSNKYVQIWDKYDSPLMTVHWTIIMRTKHFSLGEKQGLHFLLNVPSRPLTPSPPYRRGGGAEITKNCSNMEQI